VFFFTTNAHFRVPNTFFSTPIAHFITTIVYFFAPIVHFFILTVHFTIENFKTITRRTNPRILVHLDQPFATRHIPQTHKPALQSKFAA
jgi:hypothetical protein